MYNQNFFQNFGQRGYIINFFLNQFFLDKNSNFKQKCNIKTDSDREFFFIYFNEKRLRLIVKNRLKN